MKFYNREKELEILQQTELQSRTNATFTVLMGRRRVGKTALLMHAFDHEEFAYLFVSKDSEAMLCRKFQDALEQQLQLSVFGTGFI